jgi:membrane protein YqaA with SNARE-associated domain
LQPILADLAASQPLGRPSTLSALSAIAGTLGGTQSWVMSQQGPDQITNYLSQMSTHQLLGMVSEIKFSKIDSAILALFMLVMAICFCKDNKCEILVLMLLPFLLNICQLHKIITR